MPLPSDTKSESAREHVVTELVIAVVLAVALISYELATDHRRGLTSAAAIAGALAGAVLARRRFGTWSAFIDAAVRRDLALRQRHPFTWLLQAFGCQLLVVAVGAVILAFGDVVGRQVVIAAVGGFVGWCVALAIGRR